MAGTFEGPATRENMDTLNESELWRYAWARSDTTDALLETLVDIAVMRRGEISPGTEEHARQYAEQSYGECFREETFAEVLSEAKARANQQHALCLMHESADANLVADLERQYPPRPRPPGAEPIGQTDQQSSAPVTAPDPKWVVRHVNDVFAKLEPINYLFAPLDICAGAPTLVAGYGFSGKTVACQSMAISIASGQKVFGCYAARRGRVIHIDYEQGFRLTRERYQRLAAGMMVTPDELRDRLSVVAMPQLYMDDPAHEKFLCAQVEGFDLAIVDSLRACGPSIEENDSSVRGLLDMLNRVSDKTGCCFIVIHHARKPARDGASAGGAKMAVRGSGAIFDACASVVILEAEKGKPTRVIHEKARTSGITSDDFLMRVEDQEVDGNPRGGLVVLAESTPMAGTAAGSFEALKKRALEALAKGPKASKTALAACFTGNVQQKYAAIDQLVMEGSVVIDGKRFLLPHTS